MPIIAITPALVRGFAVLLLIVGMNDFWLLWACRGLLGNCPRFSHVLKSSGFFWDVDMKLKMMLAVLLLIGALVVLDFSHPEWIYAGAIKATRVAAGLKAHKVTIDGMEYAYLDNNKMDAPVLLEVHGFTGDKDNFSRMNVFVDNMRIVAPDLLGHGESSAPEEANYSISSQVGRLHQFVETLKLGKVHIAGNSMGGHIAAMYASQYPDEVASVTLLDNSGVLGETTPDLLQNYFDTGEIPLILHDSSEVDNLFAYIFVNPPLMTPNLKRAFGEAMSSKSKLYEKIFDDFILTGYEPLEDLLGNISAPVHIIWGENDRVLHRSSIDVMRPRLQKVRTTILPNVGHVPMMEVPYTCARVLTQFLNEERQHERQQN